MPKISLVVCIYKERDLLERLLEHAEGCYDDLVVVHDGPEEGDPDWRPGPPRPELSIDWATVPPDAPLLEIFQKTQRMSRPGSVRELVERRGGRFFEGIRCGQQEPHWPLAWWAARHDWILRLDADEFPSEEMKAWLKDFRKSPELADNISGYTCIWPLWNGWKSVGCRWPDGRIFLFNKNRVSYVGLVEITPIPHERWDALPLVLHHEPLRKSYGYRTLLFRKQNWIWRQVIAASLLKRKPCDYPRWRWPQVEDWPPPFAGMRDHPFSSMVRSFFLSWRWGLRQIIRERQWKLLYCIPAYGWHHGLICWMIIWLRLARGIRVANVVPPKA